MINEHVEERAVGNLLTWPSKPESRVWLRVLCVRRVGLIGLMLRRVIARFGRRRRICRRTVGQFTRQKFRDTCPVPSLLCASSLNSFRGGRVAPGLCYRTGWGVLILRVRGVKPVWVVQGDFSPGVQSGPILWARWTSLRRSVNGLVTGCSS